MEETIQKYHEDHEVVFTLMVEVDGEVIAKATSKIDADDAAMYTETINSQLQQHIIADANDRAEYQAEAAAEAQMEMERGN